MSTPITWKNVTGPSLAEASRPLEVAQRSFSGAFDGINDLFKKQETIDAANWTQTKDNNTQAFLDKLYAAQGPEGFKQLQASGELDKMIASNGVQIDRAAARAAVDTRLGTLQGQAQKGWEYQRAAEDEKAAPLLGEARNLMLSGKFEDMTPLMGQMDPRNRALVAGEMDKYRRELVVRSQTDAKAAKDLVRVDAEIDHWKRADETAATQARASVMSANAAQTQAGASLRQAAAHEKQVDFAQLEHNEKRLTELVKAKGSLGGGTIGSSDGQKFVVDEISKVVPAGEDRNRLFGALETIRADPQFKDARPADVVTSLLGDVSTGSAARKFFWNGTGDSAADSLKKILNSGVNVKSDTETKYAVSTMDQQIAALKSALKYPNTAADPVNPAKPGVPVPGAAPGAAAPSPQPGAAAPATGSTNTWSPELRNAYRLEQAEMAARVRPLGSFSPEVQKAIEQDKIDLTKATADQHNKRVEMAKKTPGVPVLDMPGTGDGGLNPILAGFLDPAARAQMARVEQSKYENWAKAMDDRLQLELEKGKSR